MPRKKMDPQVFWVNVAGAATLVLFVAFCWFISEHPETVRRCSGGGGSYRGGSSC
ncbi:hypothetical protein [Caulobacter sp. 17J65-9]|uniref:hypothetical protein n=1 Tax=Caulobacter sp. 17J65-9 TaxID=2709382 RepID=UPI0013C93C89|nr:hypothetical protein [Caulobacter sp. 17J65-9]NEX91910.1 hypothetical protein [Caulobacter sp. 17J65-9]